MASERTRARLDAIVPRMEVVPEGFFRAPSRVFSERDMCRDPDGGQILTTTIVRISSRHVYIIHAYTHI